MAFCIKCTHRVLPLSSSPGGSSWDLWYHYSLLFCPWASDLKYCPFSNFVQNGFKMIITWVRDFRVWSIFTKIMSLVVAAGNIFKCSGYFRKIYPPLLPKGAFFHINIFSVFYVECCGFCFLGNIHIFLCRVFRFWCRIVNQGKEEQLGTACSDSYSAWTRGKWWVAMGLLSLGRCRKGFPQPLLSTWSVFPSGSVP